MKFVSLHGQMTFDEMKRSLERLPKTNRWVQMSDKLPWMKLKRVYNRSLRNDLVGADNRPWRMVIAALIIKHKLSLSDDEAILAIQENPYMQYMCGLTEYTDKPIFDPSLFVTIRKRITIDDITNLTLEQARKAQSKKDDDEGENPGVTRWTALKANATCADAEVRYPTDLDLVEDGSKYIDRLLDKVSANKGGQQTSEWAGPHPGRVSLCHQAQA